MHKRTLLLLATLLAALPASHVLAFETVDPGPLYGEFNATLPGNELVVPFFKWNDTNGDGYPDILGVRYDVYTAGAAPKRYQTATQSYYTLPIPAGCASPQAAREALILLPGKILRSAGSGRVTMSMVLTQVCSGPPTGKTFVYSANAASASGPSWKYGTPGFLEGSSGVDANNDGTDDSLLMMVSQEVALGTNLRAVLLDLESGAVKSDVAYPLDR